jgi:hypothetical protein
MNSIKSIMLLTAILCVSMLYAEENTYIKQQVAYKDSGADGKELTWDIGMLSPIGYCDFACDLYLQLQSDNALHRCVNIIPIHVLYISLSPSSSELGESFFLLRYR